MDPLVTRALLATLYKP